MRRHATSLMVITLLLARVAFELSPLGSQVVAEAGQLDPRGFRFLSVEAGTKSAVRYNACEPIHYVVNPNLAPAGGLEDVHQAIRMTAEASGLRFVYDGTTTEDANSTRAEYQPGRYGERWAPVLIGWASELHDADGTPGDGSGQIVGLAGSRYRENSQGHPTYVTGSAVFAANAGLNSGFGGETWGQVMLHEFAHLVGLHHVEDPSSVMNPKLGLRPATWGPGDRDGLWELGLGTPCLATPQLP